MNITNACRESWQNVISKVNRSVVFLDETCAECLHWNGGAQALLGGGATDIKQFSSFESCQPEQRKTVFVISSILMGTTEQILRDIVQSSSLQYIILITTVHPALHTMMKFGASDSEDRAFHYIEDKLMEWMGNMNYTAEVLYYPLVSAPITPHMFVLPQYSTLSPLLPSDLQTQLSQISDARQSVQLDFSSLPQELQIQIKGLAGCLNSNLEQLNMSEDVYALGATSSLLASELAGLPWAKTRRKANQQKCSLLLIDRSLDLAEPVSHQWDTLLDKILAALPLLPGHHNDVCVDMASLCAVTSNPNNAVIVPGCLAHPTDPVAASLLHTLATAKQKEALLEVNRQLVEAASRENLPIKLTGRPGRVSAEQLHGHITLFKNKPKSIRKHSGLLQIGQAVADSLTKKEQSAKWEGLQGLEKGLLQALADEEGPSPLSFISNTLSKDLERSKEERLYSVEDVFLLVLYVYSLASDAEMVGSVQEERELRLKIVSAITEYEDGSRLPVFLQHLVGDGTLEEGPVRMVLQDVFEKLKGLSTARNGMEWFSSLYEEGDGITTQTSRQPLLQQVLAAILDPNKPELPDIECKSTGFRDKLKSGFGLFMSVSKPRPSDHPCLIVFVVGGITSTEVRRITEAASSNSSIQVVVGSTRLLKPTDMLEQVLVQDNLHPRDS